MLPAASNLIGSTLRLYLSKTPASTATFDGTAKTFCWRPILIGARAVLATGAACPAAAGAAVAEESGCPASAAAGFEASAGLAGAAVGALWGDWQARTNNPVPAPANLRR